VSHYLTDNELVEKIKEGDENSLLELSSRHTGIFYKTVKDYRPFPSGVSDIDEILERKEAIVFDVVKNFDPEKSKFSSYFANRVRFLCLKERSRQKKESVVGEFEDYDPGYEDFGFESIEKRDEYKSVFDSLEECVGERRAKIIRERYINGKTMREIAREMGVSTQWIQADHKTAINLLKRKHCHVNL
jgi:RNA polymerase sigma factor (sigma-70 family)